MCTADASNGSRGEFGRRRATPGFARAVMAGALAGMLAAAASASSAFAQSAGGDFDEVLDPSAAFDQMPTSELLDLYTDVGLVLQKRRLLPAGWNPAQDYAEILVIKALKLTKDDRRGRATGAGGVKFRIVGVLPREDNAPVRLTGLGSGDFDRLAVVIFDDRFVIDRAVVAPRDVVAAKSSGGALVLSDAVLEHAGVEDVTVKVDRLTGDEF